MTVGIFRSRIFTAGRAFLRDGRGVSAVETAFAFPVILAAFFIIEKFVTGPYWVTQLPADQLIPFCPYFIFFYMSWSPLLAVLGVSIIAVKYL